MVKHLLDQIMSPNTELKKEVNICRSSHSSTFFKASTYLSKVVARLYPPSNPSSGRSRKRSIYAADSGDRGGRRGGSFNGRVHGIILGGRGGRGRGGHFQGGLGGDSGVHENIINISDVTRYFGDSDWAALSNYTRKIITEDPVRTKLQENQKRRTTRSVSSGKGKENRLISHILPGVKNASQNEYVLEGGVTRFSTNGGRAQVYAANRGSTY